MVTVKRIDPVSAMRVGALVYALLFTVMAVLIALFQSLILSGLSSLANSSSFSVNGAPANFNGGSLAAAGLATCGCGYLIGVIGAVIAGGIFGLLVSFSYNLVSNWFGGLRVQINPDEEGEKLKREISQGNF